MPINFQITITNTTIFLIDVVAENETEAKEKANEKFDRIINKMHRIKGFDVLQTQNVYCGICNMDESWNKINF